jgi:hypothetical protein
MGMAALVELEIVLTIGSATFDPREQPEMHTNAAALNR